jgi:hypothetical protein
VPRCRPFCPFAIKGDELDDHFVFPVREAVETVNNRFKGQCHSNSDSSAVRRRLASSDETDIV